jgi:hypothetical protein
MNIAMVALPVRCPKCDAQGLSEFPFAVVAVALMKWNNMCLYAPCHEGAWDAGEKELEAIRHYLGREWLREHAKGFAEPRSASVAFLEGEPRESMRNYPQVASIRHAVGTVTSIEIRSLQASEVN